MERLGQVRDIFLFSCFTGLAYAAVQKQKRSEIVTAPDGGLRCHVVVELELKVTEFQPEYAGKLSFYLNAVDAQLRHPNDNPSIGILLCKTPNKVVVEYSLKNATAPLGVA